MTYGTEVDQLEKMVKILAFDTPKQFISMCNEANKDKRLAIYFASRNGEEIRKRGERYETSGGEPLGTIYDVIEKMGKENDFEKKVMYSLQQARNAAKPKKQAN